MIEDLLYASYASEEIDYLDHIHVFFSTSQRCCFLVASLP